jgi:hypothetical protein
MRLGCLRRRVGLTRVRVGAVLRARTIFSQALRRCPYATAILSLSRPFVRSYDLRKRSCCAEARLHQ